MDIPAGWTVALDADGQQSREECLRYVEANWTDLRPRSLRERMDDLPSKPDG